jgi:hypothetical protein
MVGSATAIIHEYAGEALYILLFWFRMRPYRTYWSKSTVTEKPFGLTKKVDDWNWVDALQMAMPVFVKLGNLYNDTKIF